MIRVCACNHSAQHGWQTSFATFWPSSVGKGAKPSGGRFFPQRAHLISSGIEDSGFEFRVCSFESNCRIEPRLVQRSRNRELETRNSKLETLFLRCSDRPNDVVILGPNQTDWPHIAMSNNAIRVDH